MKKIFLLMAISFLVSSNAPSAITIFDDSKAAEASGLFDHSFPFGKTPVIDGVLKADEWADAASAFIDVEEGWRVKVFYKRHASNLYFAFSDLKNKGRERYPEIMIDAKGDRGASWGGDDWWLHISYNDCEGKGRYNVWNCTPAKPGWKANNFPLPDPGTVEAEVSYEKLGITPGVSKMIGLAFNVTDTRSDYDYWPASARLADPSSWAAVKLSD
ncbi:MAG: hypothetical protein L0229_20680 [Blastocatellia bacterium]|nr:hypothetical protein [Blastocatellia bacterium]